MNRRTFLTAMSALSWAMSRWPARPASAQRALILVWCDGGMSHLDTFDGKPGAPRDIRGDLPSMATAVDGVFFSSYLPELGKRMDRCTLIRSLTHGEGNHDRGAHYLLTGRRPSPVLTYPSLGAILASHDAGALPPYVAIPRAPEYGKAGFLSVTRAPFELERDPAQNFQVPNLHVAADSERARELAAAMDALDRPRSQSERERDHFAARARALAEDPRNREVFALDREPASLRERYGRHRLGQSCLLARRLVQAGVGSVLVHFDGWDHHQNIANGLTYGFPPKLVALDQGLSALIDDLEAAQLGDRVVVCVASEFGRTPRINPLGGRDHWPRAQSVLLYGAGIRRGAVVGSTDARGEEPATEPVSPADLFATLAAALGLDAKANLQTDQGRPVRLIEDGASAIAKALA